MMRTAANAVATAVLAGLLLASPAAAQNFANTGQAGANFLQIPSDGVNAALGNSGIGLLEGVEAIPWNPAAIHRHDDTAAGGSNEVFVGHADWILDTRLTRIGYTRRLPGFLGTVGIGGVSFGMDDMDITTELNPNGTGETFSAGDLAAGVTWANALSTRFRFGITGKWVHEYIWTASANTFAFDLGTTYRADFLNLRIGMSILNFGADMLMEGDAVDERLREAGEMDSLLIDNPQDERVAEDYQLPQEFNVGIAFDPWSTEMHRVTVTAMVNDPNDNVTRTSFGVEYAFREMALLRGGWKFGYDEQSFSAGFGFRLPIARVTSALDYAYVHLGRLEGAHLLTYRVRL
jgi:hypothetical protein